MSPQPELLNNFQESRANPSLEQLLAWKEQGYTDIVLFGRLQPPHRGHRALLETLRASGLNVNLVLNDKTDDIPGERNPFNPHQREAMARLSMPWLSPDAIQHATVYLGGGGDVGDQVRRLTGIFNNIAPQGKLVFAYFEKAEDRKKYLVDGEIIKGAHYVELVGQPRGEFPIQRVTADMITEVSEYVRIDAKMFRARMQTPGQNQGLTTNDLCYDLLDKPVADYAYAQLLLAERNGRLVGESQTNDTITLQQVQEEIAASTSELQTHDI